MESLETKFRRVRDAVSRFSISNNSSPVRSGRPCVTWADDDVNNPPASPRLLQRIQSFTSPRHSPCIRRRPLELDNRPSPRRSRRVFYHAQGSGHGPPLSSSPSPTSSSSFNYHPCLHGVSSSPCLRRVMPGASSPQNTSLTLPFQQGGFLDNRPQPPQGTLSPEYDSERNCRIPVSPNLAAKVRNRISLI